MRQLINGFLLFLLVILVSCHSSDREKIRHLNTGFMGHGVELMNDAVYAFARDGDSIWVGYGFLGAGVTKYNIKTGKSLHFGNFLQENGVTYSVGGITNIVVTKNHVWLAGGGVVHCLDRETDKVIRRYYEGHGLPVSRIMCMTESEGKIYVGLIRYGFTVIDDENLEGVHSVELRRTPDLMTNPDEFHTVESIAKIKQGLFLSLSGDGIYLFQSAHKLKLLRNTSEFMSSTFSVTPKGIFLVLVPTEGNAFCIEEWNQTRFVRRRDLDFILGKWQEVSVSFYDWKDRLWFAVSQLGICCFDQTSKTIRIVSDDEILVDRHKFVYGFYFDGEYFWIGTPHNGAQMIPKDIMMKYVAKAKPIPIPREYWKIRGTSIPRPLSTKNTSPE